MRAIRFAIAVLIATALAVLPVSAGVAKPPAIEAEMSMSRSDAGCPHCDMAPDSAADICKLNCCGIAAILAGAQPPAARSAGGTDTAATGLAPFSPPPDPPPPRS